MPRCRIKEYSCKVRGEIPGFYPAFGYLVGPSEESVGFVCLFWSFIFLVFFFFKAKAGF